MLGANTKCKIGQFNWRPAKKEFHSVWKEIICCGMLSLHFEYSCQTKLSRCIWKQKRYTWHIQQLHYNVGWIHHEKLKFYQSMYPVLNLLTEELPLQQMWIETRFEYIHNHMQWYSKYEEPCISLVKHMVSWLQRSDCHLSIWKEIIKMSSYTMIKLKDLSWLNFLNYSSYQLQSIHSYLTRT